MLSVQACSVYFARKALMKELNLLGNEDEEEFDIEKEIEQQVRLEHWLGSKYGFDSFLEFTGISVFEKRSCINFWCSQKKNFQQKI